MVAFVPVSVEVLADLPSTPLVGPTPAFAVTTGLCDTFSLTPADDEEAERTALLLAGLSSVMAHGRRLVLVVDARASDLGGGLGECTLNGVNWKDVSAIFADAPEADSAVTEASSAAAGLDLDDAWDVPTVQTLLSEHDLLWFGPEEVGALTRA